MNDDGAGFDPLERSDLGDIEALSEGGLGIAIIRAIADDFSLARGPDGRGSRLRFVKALAD